MEKFGGFDLFMVGLLLVTIVMVIYGVKVYMKKELYNDNIHSINEELFIEMTSIEGAIKDAKYFDYIYLNREYTRLNELRLQALEVMISGKGDSITNSILYKLSNLKYELEIIIYNQPSHTNDNIFVLS